MKSQLALITCLLLLPTSVIAAPPITNINIEQKIGQNNSEQLQQQAKAITVKITSDDNGGSGVLIAQQQQTYLVLTNAHVTKNGKNFRIQTPDGEIHSASLVSDVNFPNHDLALLQFSSNKQYTIAKLNKLAPHPDTTILAAGFDGETGQLVYSNGKITQVPSPALVQGYQIGYTSNIVQGMSGGPILDETGELIGINGRSAYPILNTGYVYSDSTRPTPEQIQQLRSVNWGIPIATFLAQVPHETAIAYSLPKPQIGWLGQLNEQAKKITVRIDDFDNPEDKGSGIIIAKQNNTYYVLTCEHVAVNVADPKNKIPKNNEIITPDGKTYSVEPSQIKTESGVDLAVVQFTSHESYQVATIGDARIADKQYLFVAGYSKLPNKPSEWRFSPGDTFSRELGLIQVKSDVIDGKNTATLQSASSLIEGYELVYTNITYGGMSGGPVLDTQGRVIGIHGRIEDKKEAIDEKANDLNYIQLGYSLGIPVRTFLGLAERLNVNPQWLQVQHALPSQLNEQQQKDVKQAVLTVDVPKGNAKASVWIERGNQLWRLRRYDEAIAAFDEAIKLKPAFVYLAWYGKGLALDAQKKYASAADAFEQAINNQPDFYIALKEQSVVLRESKQLEPALAAIEKAIIIQPNDANLYIEKGYDLGELKRYPEGIAAYTQGIQLSPRAAFYNNRALLYQDQKKWDLALADFNTAIQLNPELADAYNNRGILYKDQKKWDLALADYNTAIQLDPSDAKAYNNRGILYKDQKKWDLALADFNTAIQLDPELDGAYNNRAIFYKDQKKWDLALADYNTAIKLNPEYASTYFDRAIFYKDQKKWDLALADYNTAIKLNPEYGEAYNNRGVLYYNQKKWDLALADYNTAIKLDHADTFAHNNRGNLYKDQKKWDLALADFNTALKLNPEYADAYNNRGILYNDEKKWDLALADFNTAIKLNSESAEAYNNRGNLYDDEKKWDLALADFNTAIKLNPEFANAYNNRGVVYNDEKKWDLALADFNTAIKLNPEFANAYNNRGNLYHKGKKWDLALADYNNAIKLNPEYALAYYNRGNLYDDQKKWELAIADYNIAIKLNPEYDGTYVNRGNLYHKGKKWDLALADYNTAIQLNPKFVEAYNNRGSLYQDQKKWDLAIADYNTAIKLNPEFTLAYNNRGNLYKDQKKWDLALADYNAAIKFNPEYAEAYYNRGILYSNQKKWDLALADYSAAIKLNPSDARSYNNRGIVYYKLKQWDLAVRDLNQTLTIISPEYARFVIYTIGIVKYEMGATDSAIQQWQQVVNQFPELQLALAVSFYTQGETEKAFQLADTALRSDKRLANLAYLKDNLLQENLWSDRLLSDTQKFYTTPRMQALLSQIQGLSGGENK